MGLGIAVQGLDVERRSAQPQPSTSGLGKERVVTERTDRRVVSSGPRRPAFFAGPQSTGCGFADEPVKCRVRPDDSDRDAAADRQGDGLSPGSADTTPDFPYLHAERKRPGVTLALLHFWRNISRIFRIVSRGVAISPFARDDR